MLSLTWDKVAASFSSFFYKFKVNRLLSFQWILCFFQISIARMNKIVKTTLAVWHLPPMYHLASPSPWHFIPHWNSWSGSPFRPALCSDIAVSTAVYAINSLLVVFTLQFLNRPKLFGMMVNGKMVYNDEFQFSDWSTMCKVVIWFVHDLLWQKPAWRSGT